MATLFTAESRHGRGFEFEHTRSIETQGDLGWGVQKKNPTHCLVLQGARKEAQTWHLAKLDE